MEWILLSCWCSASEGTGVAVAATGEKDGFLHSGVSGCISLGIDLAPHPY